MRQHVFSLALVTAALMGGTQTTFAQSPYSYPWCLRFGGGASCYFTSKEQCMTTLFGEGGYCVQNPHFGRTAMASPSPPRRQVRNVAAKKPAAPPPAPAAVAPPPKEEAEAPPAKP
jgi:Protein of unknown function (DUF3551)